MHPTEVIECKAGQVTGLKAENDLSHQKTLRAQRNSFAWVIQCNKNRELNANFSKKLWGNGPLANDVIKTFKAIS